MHWKNTQLRVQIGCESMARATKKMTREMYIVLLFNVHLLPNEWSSYKNYFKIINWNCIEQIDENGLWN